MLDMWKVTPARRTCGCCMQSHNVRVRPRRGLHKTVRLQGYLAHKKLPPQRTLQQANAQSGLLRPLCLGQVPLLLPKVLIRGESSFLTTATRQRGTETSRQGSNSP